MRRFMVIDMLLELGDDDAGIFAVWLVECKDEDAVWKFADKKAKEALAEIKDQLGDPDEDTEVLEVTNEIGFEFDIDTGDHVRRITYHELDNEHIVTLM